MNIQEWFNNLSKHRQIELQKRYFEYNKYFEELNGDWWFNDDYEYETIDFVKGYAGQVLTPEEFEQVKLLKDEY